jgi:hypothetical protein
MKFCYLDESGMGDEPILVMAGVIVDAQRMHQTKAAWADFLDYLSSAIGQKVSEFHTCRFYRGSGSWRRIDGTERSELISAIINWVSERKHHITFSAINKQLFSKQKDAGYFVDINSPWCAAAVHCILSLQKYHQRQSKNKGHTVIIFDRGEEGVLTKIVLDPPEWINSYYDKNPKQPALDQIVDVPFFVDSEQALLIQVADMVSFILRTYAELKIGIATERYAGERIFICPELDLI